MVSRRELGTGERWFRGALAPLDIIPGAMAVKKFSGVARTVSFVDDLGQLGKTTSLTNKAQSSIQKVNDLALTARKGASTRLKSASAVIKKRAAEIPMVQSKMEKSLIKQLKIRKIFSRM